MSETIRIEQLQRQIAAYNSGGFADADAMAEKYLEISGQLAAEQSRVRDLEAALATEQSRFTASSGRWEKARAREIEKKNTAYSERDRLVCAISKVFPSHIERHPDSDLTWEDDWRWIVFVQFPTGQASWHIHDSELGWFDHLERRDSNSWDGHTTAEKYARIERFERIGEMTSLEAENVRLREALEALEKSCTRGMECGDWGNFTIEQWPELAAARAALAPRPAPENKEKP